MTCAPTCTSRSSRTRFGASTFTTSSRRTGPESRRERAESERFKRFTYDDLIQRDKASLDLIWLRDESLEDTDNLPAPEIIAQEIIEDLEAALAEFAAVADSLGRSGGPGESDSS